MTDLKKCPYCGEDIKLEAIKCKHCKTILSKEDNALTGVVAPVRPQEEKPTEKKSDSYFTGNSLKSWIIPVIAAIVILYFFSGIFNGYNEDVAEVERAGEDVSVNEATVYDGAFKFTGEAIKGVEITDVIIDLSVTADEERGNYTDIVMTEGMTDIAGNVFQPGTYEFQFVEFPENQDMGSWYVWFNIDSDDPIRISGNPNASDAGKEYELKEGDTISVDFWTIATFYKVQ